MKLDELYPSRWLKASDVARPILVTIKSVTIAEISDGKEKPILNFLGGLTKSMVLNRTNSGTIGEIYGTDTDAWIGKPIVLFSTKVTMNDKMVDAIRCRAPKPAAPTITRAAVTEPAAPTITRAAVTGAGRAEDVEFPSDDVPF